MTAKAKRFLPPFELWIAVLAVYVALAKVFPGLSTTGGSRAVELAFPHLVNLWITLYGTGGLFMILGLLLSSPRIEGAGLHLLGSGVTVSMIASLAAGAPIVPTIIVNGGVAVACILRLLFLRKLA